MTSKPDISELVPHAGKMCLLQRVLRWDDSSVTIATTTHRDPDNPLLHEGRLRAVHLCEYGAQAIAVHGGLRARALGTQIRPGLLVSLRNVSLYRDDVHGLAGELIIEAHSIHENASALQYEFRVTHKQELLAQGRAIVSLSPNA